MEALKSGDTYKYFQEEEEEEESDEEDDAFGPKKKEEDLDTVGRKFFFFSISFYMLRITQSICGILNLNKLYGLGEACKNLQCRLDIPSLGFRRWVIGQGYSNKMC